MNIDRTTTRFLRLALIIGLLFASVLSASPRAVHADIFSPEKNFDERSSNFMPTGRDPQVATDRHGTWVAVWISQDRTAEAQSSNHKVLFSVSHNAGDTWTVPEVLNSNWAQVGMRVQLADIAADDEGNFVVTWESRSVVASSLGTDYDILFSRSTNGGSIWSEPASLNSNAAADVGDDQNARIKSDRSGDFVAVWSSTENLGGTIGLDRDILASRSSDAGATWSAPVLVNPTGGTDSGDDDVPQVTTDEAGTWLVIWSSDETFNGNLGEDLDVFVIRSTNNGATWTGLAVVNSNARSDSGEDEVPQIATDADGNWLAAWMSNDTLGGTVGIDNDVFVARSTNLGVTWTDLALLNNGEAEHVGFNFSVQVETDRRGNWLATWISSNPVGATSTYRKIVAAQSYDAGASWSDTQRLGSANAPGALGYWKRFAPQLTTDNMGNWVAVSYAEDIDEGYLPVLVSAMHGWDADGDTLIDDDEVVLGTDPYDSDTDGDRVPDPSEVHIGSDPLDAISPTVPTPNTWNSGQARAIGILATMEAGLDSAPAVVADQGGNLIAVWSSKDTLGGTIGTDNDIVISRSLDAGASWTEPVALSSTAATDVTRGDYDPRLAFDGAGNWLVVWESNDQGPGDPEIGYDKDLLTARSSDAGLTWSLPIPLNSTAYTDVGQSAEDENPSLLATMPGHWLVVWDKRRDFTDDVYGDDSDIFYSRSSDAGATWDDAAVLNSTAATDLSGSVLDGAFRTDYDGITSAAMDAAGNIVVVWHAFDKPYPDPDRVRSIVFSRSTDGGGTWSPVAVLDLDAAASPYSTGTSPAIAVDSAGTWVVIWYSSIPHLGSVMMVSRSTDAGVSWSASVPMNHIPWNASFSAPTLVTDNMGNWLATWGAKDDSLILTGESLGAVFVHSSDAGATWSAPSPLSANPKFSAYLETRGPAIAVDSSGNWTAVWGSRDDLGGTIGIDDDILVATLTPPDADMDGLSDGVEVDVFNTDPNDPDSDNDGLLDGEEFTLRTNPNEVDTDGDGYEDGVEVNEFGSDPLVVSIDDAAPTTTASPPGGDYEIGQSVTLACDDADGFGCAATYYTTDASEPTTNSMAYSSPILVDADATLKFFSVDKASNEEASSVALYTVVAKPPAEFALISPANGGVGLTTSMKFKWEITSDPNGDNIEYELYVCEDESFEGCAPVVAAAFGDLVRYAGTAGGLSGLMWFAMTMSVGVTSNRRRRSLRQVAMIVAIGMIAAGLVAGCGSSKSKKDKNDEPTAISQEVAGLNAATTYFWKVVASDGTAETHSETWSFTTE